MIKRLQAKNDIDLVLVMGASAGYLLSNVDHDTNILVFAASNAVRSGIIDSVLNELEKMAAEKKFEIVHYHVAEPRSLEEYPRYYQEVQAAYDKLAQEVDAVYITIASLESEKLPKLFQPFYENNIPIFSQLGNIEVKNGALITVSVMDEVNIVRFGADVMGKCLQGARPRDLEQSFQSAPRIILNREVAKKIGFKFPFELLMVVDETYP
ncbi:MAG: hypothetical protein GX790_05315 [Syntrophomonadaceae bacterium]|nr:hypothetical protein [Syntrophomonadaceae bacterium]